MALAMLWSVYTDITCVTRTNLVGISFSHLEERRWLQQTREPITLNHDLVIPSVLFYKQKESHLPPPSVQEMSICFITFVIKTNNLMILRCGFILQYFELKHILSVFRKKKSGFCKLIILSSKNMSTFSFSLKPLVPRQRSMACWRLACNF